MAVAEAARRGKEIASDTDVTVFAAAVFSFYYMALIGWAQGQVAAPLVLFRRMVEQHVAGVQPAVRRKRVAKAKP